ncbi:MAG: AAA family ATPase [Bacteroidetes bacterium]|nr:AAA family ATPase [Bacteroidota bacterium]
MYKSFYGLNRNPFPKDIEPENMFKHNGFTELSSRFDYMKKQRGIMLLTGEPGSGKTTAVRNFVSGLNRDRFMPMYIPLATVAIGDFYKQINDILKGEKCSSKSTLFKSIQERILHYSVQLNIIPIIIIDEAHLLKNENFFELQIITNFNMDSLDPALIIMVAQSHLNDRLERYYLESFNQRINMKFHMSSLKPSEVSELIAYQIEKAGGSKEIFNENACKAIHSLSGGVVRKIGKLVEKSLVHGMSEKKHIITEEEVVIASKEM